MPMRPLNLRALAAALAVPSALWAGPAGAQAGASASPLIAVEAPVVNSALDAPLFYQLLVAEFELRAGSAGTAYELLLDAARMTRDERLFQRATDIALQARAGEQALAAAQAWRSTVPGSLEALRYLAQIYVGLNRAAEALDPLRRLIERTPAAERAALISLLPRYFARASDLPKVAAVVDEVLQPYVQQESTRVAALSAMARMRLLTREGDQALALARQAQQTDPGAEGPALVALELLGRQPQAEQVLTVYFQAKPRSHALRLGYVRELVRQQRYQPAIAQLEEALALEPSLAAGWLSLGALRLELKEATAAETALRRYLDLGAQMPALEDPALAVTHEGQTQAYLMLAQAAESQGQIQQAEQWLARINDPAAALNVQSRRASLLARQGRLEEGLALIRGLPEDPPEAARAKLLAEAHLLRDQRQWPRAYEVLGRAAERFPDDVDLLYEQAMMAEKIDRIDRMEQLLRRIIEIQPDHYHAYNALGYTLADRNLRLDEARQLIEKALSLAPDEPFIVDSLGWVKYRLGHRDEALVHLQRAYRARPDTEIAAHLGEVLWVMGRRDEARRVWREGRDRDASNEVLRETLRRFKVDL
jgi:tetratricopeptide (TPR) repeat protein